MQKYCKDNGDGTYGAPTKKPAVMGDISNPSHEDMIASGYIEYAPPTFDKGTQELGSLILFGDVVTREVVSLDVEAKRSAVMSDIRSKRQTRMDGILPNPGVSEVYKNNLTARDRYKEASTKKLPTGQTPTSYLEEKILAFGFADIESFLSHLDAEEMSAALAISAIDSIYGKYKVLTKTQDDLSILVGYPNQMESELVALGL